MIVLDGHVHLHSIFDREMVLDQALRNFSVASGEMSTRGIDRVLLFADPQGNRSLERFFDLASDAPDGRWRVTESAEPISARAMKSCGESVILISGSQVQTSEGLEILALACSFDNQPSLSASDTIGAVAAAGGIPVLPWGFGKWMFKRRQSVLGILEALEPSSYFLGMTEKRPERWHHDRLWAHAAQMGVRNLQGTDPFPMIHQANIVGTFGSFLEATLDPDRPAQNLRELLLSPQTQPTAYGSGCTLRGFLTTQISIRLGSRAGSRPD